MDKWTAELLYHGILLSNKKKQHTVPCWEKEARLKWFYMVWFQFYKILKQNYKDGGQIGDC